MSMDHRNRDCMTRRRARGFTLVETLVAITVLLVAIVGPLYAVHRSLTASYTARDQLVATAIAQEGVEFVRGIRDTNYLANRSWLIGLTPACTNTNGCVVDPHTLAVTTCGPGPNGCPVLRLATNSLYRQEATPGDSATRFRRQVKITAVSSTEVLVTVTVSWSTLRIPYSVTVNERLYNWL